MYANMTVKVTEETKKRLEKLKLIPQDTMDNVISRLLDRWEKNE